MRCGKRPLAVKYIPAHMVFLHSFSSEVAMMAYIDVLARAYRSEPLRRIAIETGEQVVYLANPEYLREIEAGESDPVGYPKEDVFEFDADLYRQLLDQWEREGRTDDALWRAARPVAPVLP